MDAYLQAAMVERGHRALCERLLAGTPATAAEAELLGDLPLPLLCWLADALRQRAVGQGVRLVAVPVIRSGVQPPQPAVVDCTGLTGGCLLRAVALRRLTAGQGQSVAVGWLEAGLPMAELALTAGADLLFGDLRVATGGSSLARRAQLEALAQRNGRTVTWVERTAPVQQAATPTRVQPALGE